MRQLKFHERKLLKKVDFLQWKSENNHRELEVSCVNSVMSATFAMGSGSTRLWTVMQIMRRYHIQGRDDYKKYSKLCGVVTRLVHFLKKLESSDPVRIELTDQLLEKYGTCFCSACSCPKSGSSCPAYCRLFALGIITTKKSLIQLEKLTVSSFCRRRLAVVMVRTKMSETVREAITFIEQGHVRVGPQTVTEPAFLVTRNMEDFVTWVDTSKIKRKVLQYNDRLDDYDLLS